MISSDRKEIQTGGGAAIQGDVDNQGGKFIGRDNITFVIQMQPFEPPPDVETLRDAYLTHLKQTNQVLDFRGIPQLENFSSKLMLEEVYVPLVARPEMPKGETWERRLAGRMFRGEDLPEDAMRLAEQDAPVAIPVEKAIGEANQVVVLGDPGSGKSTLLKYLTLQLASEDQAPLPILVPLNAYARALEEKGDCNLQSFLPRYFADLVKGLAQLDVLIHAALENGQAVVLLDGLDEVQANRGRLVHKVEAFVNDVVERGNKVVITSRIVGYREAPLNPRIWALYTLLDFNQENIAEFARKWCLAFETSTLGDTPAARQNAEAERLDLLVAIDTNPGVARLASNPLLLTILALIKRQGVSLPNRRVELYELYLETLIRAWNKARALDRHQVGPDLNTNDILMTLGPLALWMRAENPTAGVVTEDALIGELTRHFSGEDWGLPRGEARKEARSFMLSVHKYSNLLVERGPKQFGFLHLTFEEMLAAYGLYQKGQLNLDESLDVICQHMTDPGWRETLLLAIGVWGLANKQPKVAGKIVTAIVAADPGYEHPGENLLLAGACLEDVGVEGIGRPAARQVKGALLDASRDRKLPPTAQRDAGFILGRTGWVPDDLNAFIDIPAGPFLYGHEKETIKIEKPYAIAKYPVTNLQYQRFMGASGYQNQEYWSPEGWAWRNQESDEVHYEPCHWRDVRWNNPLSPVVGVCWYEAEAYCNWLSGEIEKPVRLPTEQEWERAVRGIDGREYPWGDEFDRRKLNCAEFWTECQQMSADEWNKWLGREDLKEASTTIVGQFGAGKSPVEAEDMSGNAFEWTASWYEKEKERRVVRGGSWIDYYRFARCAFRFRFFPEYRYYYIGFRVVVLRSDR